MEAGTGNEPGGHQQRGRWGLRDCQVKPGFHGAAREAPQFTFHGESPSSISFQGNHCVIPVAPEKETRKLEIQGLVLDSSPTCCVILGQSFHLHKPHFSEQLHCYSFLATQQVPSTELSAFAAGSLSLLALCGGLFIPILQTRKWASRRLVSCPRSQW